MPDLTAMVITGGFITALGMFVIAAWVQRARGRQSAQVRGVDGGWGDDAAAGPGSLEPALPPRLPVGRVPVWFYLPVDLVGAGLVYVVFATLILGSLRVTPEPVTALRASTLLVNIGFQFVMAGAVAILVVRRVGWVTWLGLRWPGWGWVFVIAPGGVLVMWALFGGLQASGYMEWMQSLGVETVQDTVKILQKSEDPLTLGLMAVAAVIAAPLCEEVMFRGYLYPVLKKFAGGWPAALSSALVFGCAHGDLTALLPLFLFGCLLVFIYEKTGSLWAPIAVHCCFNSATVLVQIAARVYHLPLDGTP